MGCGCKKRMADMEASQSAVVRKAARLIRPAHNVAMKVMDRAFPEKPKKKQRRPVGALES